MLLQKMDSAQRDTETPLLFIATTNRRELVDAAGKRRFGDRGVLFGNLDACGALGVLEKKLPEGVPLATGESCATEDPASARRVLLRRVLFHLFGDGDEQRIAEIVLRDSSRVPVHRRDLISGAILDSAVSRAKDEAMRRAAEAGELLGIDGETLIAALDDLLDELVAGFSPQNVIDYVPHLFDGPTTPHVASVHPVARPGRRRGARYSA